MKKQKKKLGARILSESEIKMTLPGIKSVYEHIEVFRNNAVFMQEEQQEYEQRTNNIGIMGCRGAGKTSIMRSVHKKIKEQAQEKGDVVLPIIIPENMSSCATLMDVVLGMLKTEVESRKRKNTEPKRGECIYTGRNSLEKAYNEMVKKYCYIKKDYRNILIQQFTTEQYYVDKTKEVFNSDTEFIKEFNDFIKLLLSTGTDSVATGMLFLFIDDIDLSTTRCMDVVKTLLSYLSNPRIITIISGDLETFEEALTLDFLRQEKALSGEGIQQTYYSAREYEESTLLERKKKMAYEYLKKILPPAYRKYIKYWSLEDRGFYQISDVEGNPQKNLGELLMEVTGERIGKSYFVYNENEEKKFLGATFHLFDDTARGLNNVYNVLQEILDNEIKEKRSLLGVDERTVFWRLIETIVDSKPLYARYRKQILGEIILLTQEGVKVDFRSARNWLYENNKNITDCEVEAQEKKTQEKESQEKVQEKEEEDKEEEDKEEDKTTSFLLKERFSYFLLVDFAAGLFKLEKDEEYKALKNKIIEEYINDETIDGRIASLKTVYKIEFQVIDKKANKMEIGLALKDLLTKGDFIFSLYFIGYLGRENILNILKKENWESTYKVADALVRTIRAMRETVDEQKKYLTTLYLQISDVLSRFLQILPATPEVIYGEQLVRDILLSWAGGRFWISKYNLLESVYYNEENFILEARGKNQISKNNLLWALGNLRKIPYWIYYEKNIREKSKKRKTFDIERMSNELLYRGMAKTFTRQVEPILDHYQITNLSPESYGSIMRQSGSKEKEVIFEIDENSLWKHIYVKKKVYPYLRDKKMDYIMKVERGRIVFDASDILQGEYLEFESCYKGNSGNAYVCKLENKLKEIFFLGQENRNVNEHHYMCMEQVLVIIFMLEEFLQNHEGIQYGKKETRKLLMAMKELPLVIHTSKWEEELEKLQKSEENFFKKKKLFPQDCTVEIFKNVESDVVVKNILDRSSSNENRTRPLKYIIEEYAKEQGVNLKEEQWAYMAYLVQTEKIKALLKKNEISDIDKWEKENWAKLEENISKEELRFYLHSFLRYKQANDSQPEQIGVWAEAVSTLVTYLLDSEQIGDNQIQNDIYKLISKNMDLTEEEFENLFR